VSDVNFPHILAAAQLGADWAWTSIYRDLAPSVIGYARARGAREPEDLTGEVFLQVVRDLRRFDGTERDFRAWVFTIARHRVIDEGRRRGRQPQVDPAPHFETKDEPSGNAEEEALEALNAEWVRGVITGLSGAQRDVVLLRVLGDLTVEEVARVVGKSPGAVKALQRRGLAEIRVALSREGVTP
jgi:RNA polymerase sigma-70 factor (ECF subfamily)